MTFARRAVRGLAAALLLFVAAGPAGAAILYNQPPDFPPNNFNFYTTSTAPGSPGFRAYDSFVLSQPATITGFNWQGLYYDFVNLANNPVNPNTTSWQIGIYASNPATGLPSAAPLSTFTLPAAAVTATFVANAVIFDGRNSPVRILSFHADLPTPFEAQAGVRYWFSPFSVQTSFPPLFGWTSGSGGDGRFVQDNLGTGGRNFSFDRDRAFSVEGAPVPAPAGYAVFLLGTAAIGVRLRGRVRKPHAS